MKLPVRLPALCFIGVLLAGSTALGYYYLYVYGPPLDAAEAFMAAMEAGNARAVADTILMSVDDREDMERLREATLEEATRLVDGGFDRGRILDQRKREGPSRSYHYLVYREPDGQVYALVATEYQDGYRIVIPEDPMSDRHPYLWDYTWTN